MSGPQGVLSEVQLLVEGTTSTNWRERKVALLALLKSTVEAGQLPASEAK
jgi:hypothetical protein